MKRWGLRIFRASILLFAVLLVWGLYYYDRDYADSFRERQGSLAEVSTEYRGKDSLGERYWIRLRSSSGLQVVCGALVPPASPEGTKYPVVVLLGGKATGKYAVDYAMDLRNVILVAPDYPYEPRASYSAADFAADIPEIRQAIFDMFPSVMLVMDYLRTRNDVDTARLVMLGYSFGAPFVPCIVAHERRFAVAAIVYGGGGLRTMIGHNVRRYEGAIAGEVAGLVSGFLLGPVEPLRFAGRISPIPLVMINGTEDEQIPRENAELLFQAAGEPKKITWIESHHVHPRNVDLTRKIIGTLKSEMVRLGILPEVQERHAVKRSRGAGRRSAPRGSHVAPQGVR